MAITIQDKRGNTRFYGTAIDTIIEKYYDNSCTSWDSCKPVNRLSYLCFNYRSSGVCYYAPYEFFRRARSFSEDNFIDYGAGGNIVPS